MKKLLFTAVITATAFSLQAQTNFSGTWKLKDKQYISGPEYGNALSDQITIEQNKDSMILETLSTDQDGNETKSLSAIAMNGKISSSTSAQSGRKLDRSLQWSADKKTLTITTAIHKVGADEIELTRVDTYSMTGGKQLTINRKSIETTSENWEVEGIYEKQ